MPDSYETDIEGPPYGIWKGMDKCLPWRDVVKGVSVTWEAQRHEGVGMVEEGMRGNLDFNVMEDSTWYDVRF